MSKFRCIWSAQTHSALQQSSSRARKCGKLANATQLCCYDYRRPPPLRRTHHLRLPSHATTPAESRPTRSRAQLLCSRRAAGYSAIALQSNPFLIASHSVEALSQRHHIERWHRFVLLSYGWQAERAQGRKARESDIDVTSKVDARKRYGWFGRSGSTRMLPMVAVCRRTMDANTWDRWKRARLRRGVMGCRLAADRAGC